MSQEQGSGCFKAFVIFCFLNVLLIGVIGAGYYAVWKKNGSPSVEVIQAMLEEKQGMQFGSPSSDDHSSGGHESSSAVSSASASRPIVATAPIQGNPSNYKSYTSRSDVMTLVNYYSDT